MENTAIRSANSPAPTNAVARNAGARQAAGTDAGDAKGGFSLLLADMAVMGEMAVTVQTPAPVAPTTVSAELEEPLPQGELLPAEWLTAEQAPVSLPAAEQPVGEPPVAALPAVAQPAADLPPVALPSGVLPSAPLPAAAQAAEPLPATEWQPETGAFALFSLIGQTARMDGAADAALRDGRSLGVGDSDGATARQAALPMGGGRGVYGANLPPAALPTGNAWSGAHAAASETLIDAATDLVDTAAGAAQPSTLSLNPSERGAQPHGLAALLARMDTEATPWASAVAPGPAVTYSAAPAAAGGLADGAVSAVGAGGTADAAADAGSVDASMTDTAAADAVLSQPDDTWADQLSEQVAFWVQQKTQRAEMTIDRQGRPVQVQVTITGNEAHVTFRSNEQQTRDMLDAGTAQLREMLEQQGLNLASVTVQTGDAGGQGGSGRQDSSGRSASGRGDEGPGQTAVVSADLRARPDASRTVDLFV